LSIWLSLVVVAVEQELLEQILVLVVVLEVFVPAQVYQ
jgi:hypothetical protein